MGAPFGKEDTAKELQDHAAKTQDTLVDAVENAEVAEIKRAVFRALTRLRAATIKEFDTTAPRTRSRICTTTRPRCRRTSSRASTKWRFEGISSITTKSVRTTENGETRSTNHPIVIRDLPYG